jgi:hypothetical protein
VITILADRNIERQAETLWGVLASQGWLRMVSIQVVTFAGLGLPVNASDRLVWRFAQEREMRLLTDNRNRKGTDSLEQTIGDESTPQSLPVITVGSIDRLTEPDYRARCAERLVEIALYLENYRGTGRIFIP